LLLEFEALQHFDQRVQMRGAAGGLAVARKRDGRAHFASHQLGEFVIAPFVNLEYTLQQCDACCDARCRPRRERAACGRNRAVHVLRVAEREPLERRFGGWIDHVHPARRGRFRPAPVNVELCSV
jgi:hypothetical protein